jgi:hypothetical protein
MATVSFLIGVGIDVSPHLSGEQTAPCASAAARMFEGVSWSSQAHLRHIGSSRSNRVRAYRATKGSSLTYYV